MKRKMLVLITMALIVLVSTTALGEEYLFPFRISDTGYWETPLFWVPNGSDKIMVGIYFLDHMPYTTLISLQKENTPGRWVDNWIVPGTMVYMRSTQLMLDCVDTSQAKMAHHKAIQRI